MPIPLNWEWRPHSNLSGSIDILNCSFVNSSADQSEGAVYMEEASGNFVNCSFLNSYSQKGGAICIEDSTFSSSIVDGCSFVNSTAVNYWGGAIYSGDESANDVRNCNFTNKKAIGDNNCGGAIYFTDKTTGGVTNSNFINNAAEKSGAIYSIFPKVYAKNLSIQFL